jgi:fructose/tagatose bisphosphate aldolase
MEILNGEMLRKLFDYLCPFEKDGELKPEEERVTILAANTNIPHEVYVPAFAMAASQKPQSPMIIQMSYTSCNITGSAPSKVKPIEGVERTKETNPVVEGAKRIKTVIENYVSDYGAVAVAISLDHFKVPDFDFQKYSKSNKSNLDTSVAKAKVDDAITEMSPIFGSEAIVKNDLFNAYANYLSSPEYNQFVKDFLSTVESIKPAWGMIDTEKIPPVLDFVITKEITDGVRKTLNNHDMMIEAEFGATGSSGDEVKYEKLKGKELERFAEKVVCFIRYTDQDHRQGIAYPIGMKHAAKRDEKYEPDIERLHVVQNRLFLEIGNYVPFAEHGGTGSRYVPRGLVGKINVNTEWLVTQANFLLNWCKKREDEIRLGVKEACGTDMYTKMIPIIADAVIEKLKETGSYGKGPDLIKYLYS